MTVGSLALAAALVATPLTPIVRDAVAQTASQTATQTTAPQPPLDEQIAKRLHDDPTLEADAIRVAVDGDVATLTGMVGDEADRKTAETLAIIPGITRVENKLTTRTDVKTKTKNAATTVGHKTKALGGKVADATADGWITSRIKTRFMGDESLRESDVQVAIDDHVVTLSGSVVSEDAKKRAVSIANDVEGVNRVVDHLAVTPKKQ